MELEKIEEFHKLCEPLMEYLRENFTPHDYIIIRDSGAEILTGKAFVPFKLSKTDTD